MERVKARYGGVTSVGAPFPRRPKGMHRATYKRLKSRYNELARRWVEAPLMAYFPEPRSCLESPRGVIRFISYSYSFSYSSED